VDHSARNNTITTGKAISTHGRVVDRITGQAVDPGQVVRVGLEEAEEGEDKYQIPISKFQYPNPKHQIPNKHQAPNLKIPNGS